MMSSLVKYLSVCLVCLTPMTSWGETQVLSLFSDHGVLQRAIPIPVWGTDKPGQAISVKLGNTIKQTKADPKGNWRVDLPAMKAGGPYALTVEGTSALMAKDILIGEVWLCSGQSNMAFPLKWLGYKPNASQAATMANSQLRMFTVAKSAGGEKGKQVKGAWSVATAKSISHWSGTGYYFGQALQRHLKVPVGIINSSVGGTPIESWVDAKVLDRIPAVKGHVGWLRGQVKQYPKKKAEYDKKVKQWKAKVASAKKAGKKVPPKPKPNFFTPDSPWRPSGLYNHMIHPLAPYGIRGMAWYQGESNAGRGNVYGPVLRSMVTDWRKLWGQGDMPFLTVQLANHKAAPKTAGQKSAWAEVREAQASSLALQNTAIATAIDIGEAKDIHPKNKQDVGKRLAFAARKLAYGDDIVFSGPQFKAATIKGSAIHVTFDHVGKGLRIKGDKVTALAIAGKDKQWVWANAKLDGSTLVVSHPSVKSPAYVRYGWADNPACNLYNSADLPALPFRTDKP